MAIQAISRGGMTLRRCPSCGRVAEEMARPRCWGSLPILSTSASRDLQGFRLS